MAAQLNNFGASCYKSIVGIKKLDKKTNDIVNERIQERLLLNLLHLRQLRKLGHSLRRDDSEPAKTFALYEPAPNHGAEKRGALRLSYRENISGHFCGERKHGWTARQIEDEASDLKTWRMICCCLRLKF